MVLGEKPAGRVPTVPPPLLRIEILSPEDQPGRVAETVPEVRAFGGPYVWVIDPVTLGSDLDTASGWSKLGDGILGIEQASSKCRSTRSMKTERQAPSAAPEGTISHK